MNRDIKGIEKKSSDYKEYLLLEELDEIRKLLIKIEKTLKKSIK